MPAETLAGSFDNLSVDLSTRVGDSKLSIAGSVSVSDTLGYNVTVSAEHPDAARFVNDFGADYRLAAVNLGGLNLSADVSGTDTGAEFQIWRDSLARLPFPVDCHWRWTGRARA